ncbi:MAG: 4-amino-4-deoxychorismate lyase [Phycisphaerae bacterium]
MSEKVHLNGELIDVSAARVSVTNPAFQHGVGLFETLRAYGGRPFLLERHIERMRNSARQLDMPIDAVFDSIPAAIEGLLEANGLRDARIRFTATPPGAADVHARPTLLVMAQELTGYPPELYERGMTVWPAEPYRQSAQDPLAGHKTTCYYGRLVVLREAQARHCGEALWMTPAGHLAEGCISNVFLVKNGRLRTPPANTPILPGVTRAVVLELARAAGIEADEAPCTIDDLLAADEVFLTNSAMEVMPVTRVERRAIANERAGPVTLRLRDDYQRLTRG